MSSVPLCPGLHSELEYRDYPFTRTLHVDQTNRPGTYRHLSDAIDAVVTGVRTLILVGGGTYDTGIVIGMGKEWDIEVRAEADAVPILVSSLTPLHIATSKNAHVSFHGLRLESTNPLYPAVLVTSGSPLFHKCQLQSVHIDREADLLMEQCKVWDSPSHGMLVTGGATCEVRKCEFHRSFLYHIVMDCTTSPQIIGCSFYESGKGALVITGSARCAPLVSKCVLQDTALPTSGGAVVEDGETGTISLRPLAGVGGVGPALSVSTSTTTPPEGQLLLSTALVMEGSLVPRAAIALGGSARPSIEDNTIFDGVGCGIAAYGVNFQYHRLVSSDAKNYFAAAMTAKRMVKKKKAATTSAPAKSGATTSGGLETSVAIAEQEEPRPSSKGPPSLATQKPTSSSWRIGERLTMPRGDLNTKIRRNVIRDNGHYGILVSGDTSIISVSRCTVERNVGGGCAASDNGVLHCYDCTIQQHQYGPGCCALEGRDGMVHLHECKLLENVTGAIAEHGSYIVMDTTLVENCGTGIKVRSSGVLDIEDTKVVSCSVGIHAESGGSGLAHKSTIDSNGIGYTSARGGALTIKACSMRRNGIALDFLEGGCGTITQCPITDSTGHCQIALSGARCNPSITNCEVKSASAVAVICKAKCQGIISQTIFTGHKGAEIVRFEALCDATIEQCKFIGSEGNILVFHEGAGGAVIGSEISSACRAGVVIKAMADPLLRGNTIHYNSVGIELLPASVALIEKNQIIENSTANIQTCGIGSIDKSSLPLRSDLQPYECLVSKNVIGFGVYGVLALAGAKTQLSRNLFQKCTYGVHAAADKVRLSCIGNDFRWNDVAIAIIGGESCRGVYMANVIRESTICGMLVGKHAEPTVMDNMFMAHTRKPSTTTTPSPSRTFSVDNAAPKGVITAVALRLEAGSRGSFSRNQFLFNSVAVAAHPNSAAVSMNSFYHKNECAVVYDAFDVPPPAPPAAASSPTAKKPQPPSSLPIASASSPSLSRASSNVTAGMLRSARSPLDSDALNASITTSMDASTETAHDLLGALLADPASASIVPREFEDVVVLDDCSSDSGNDDEGDSYETDDAGGPIFLGDIFLQNVIGVFACAPVGALPLVMEGCAYFYPLQASVLVAHGTMVVRITGGIFHAPPPPPPPPLKSSRRASTAIVAAPPPPTYHIVFRGSAAAAKAITGSTSPLAAQAGMGFAARTAMAFRSQVDRSVVFGANCNILFERKHSRASLFACAFIASGVCSIEESAPLILRCSFIGHASIVKKLVDAEYSKARVSYVTDPQSMEWCLRNSAFENTPRISIARDCFPGTRAVTFTQRGSGVLHQCTISLYQEGVVVDGAASPSSGCATLEISSCWIGRCRDVGLLIGSNGFEEGGVIHKCVIAQNFGTGVVVRGRCGDVPYFNNGPASPTNGGGAPTTATTDAELTSPHSANSTTVGRKSVAGPVPKTSLPSISRLLIVGHASSPLMPTRLVDTKHNDALEKGNAEAVSSYKQEYSAAQLCDVSRDRPYNGHDKNPRTVSTSTHYPVRYCVPSELSSTGIGLWVEATGAVKLDHVVVAGSQVANVVLASRLHTSLSNCRMQTAQGFGVIVQVGAKPQFRESSFVRNGYCGVLCEPESRAFFESCLWLGNRVGLFARQDKTVMSGCTMSQQAIAAVRVLDQSSITLHRCTIDSNRSGVEVWSSAAFLRNCVLTDNGFSGVMISGNTASEGTAPASFSRPSRRADASKRQEATILACTFRRNQSAGIILRNGAVASITKSMLEANLMGIIARTHSLMRCVDCTFTRNSVGALLEWSTRGVVTMCYFTKNVDASLTMRSEADVQVLRNLYVEDAPVLVSLEGRGTFTQNTFRRPSTNCFIISQGATPRILQTRFQLLHGGGTEALHAKLLEERDLDTMADLLSTATALDATDEDDGNEKKSKPGQLIRRALLESSVLTKRSSLGMAQYEEAVSEAATPTPASAPPGGITWGTTTSGWQADAAQTASPIHANLPSNMGSFIASRPPTHAGSAHSSVAGSRPPTQSAMSPMPISSFRLASRNMDVASPTPAMTILPLDPTMQNRSDEAVQLVEVGRKERKQFGLERTEAVTRSTADVLRRRSSIMVHRVGDTVRRKSYTLPQQPAVVTHAKQNTDDDDNVGSRGESPISPPVVVQTPAAPPPQRRTHRASFFIPTEDADGASPFGILPPTPQQIPFLAPPTLEGGGGAAAAGTNVESNPLQLMADPTDPLIVLQRRRSSVSVSGASGAYHSHQRRISSHKLNMEFGHSKQENEDEDGDAIADGALIAVINNGPAAPPLHRITTGSGGAPQASSLVVSTSSNAAASAPRTQLQKDLISDQRDELLAASAMASSSSGMVGSPDDGYGASGALLMDHCKAPILFEAGGGGEIVGCVFAHNQPCSILCDGPGANPVISGCLFYDHRLCSVVVTGHAGADIQNNLFLRNANAIQAFYANGAKLLISNNTFRLNLSALEAIEGDCGKISGSIHIQDETSMLCGAGAIVKIVDTTFIACDDAVVGEPNSILLMDSVTIIGCQDAITLQSDEPTVVNPVGHADGTTEVLRNVNIKCCANGIRIGNRRDSQIQDCDINTCALVGMELTAPPNTSILANVPSSVMVVHCSITGCHTGYRLNGDACQPTISNSCTAEFCGTGINVTNGSFPRIDGLIVRQCLKGVVVDDHGFGIFRGVEVNGCDAGIVLSCGSEDYPAFQRCLVYDCSVVGIQFERGAAGQVVDSTIFECAVGVMYCDESLTYMAHTKISHPSNNTITNKNDALRITKFANPRMGPNVDLNYQGSPAHNSRTARMRRIDREKAREAHEEVTLPALTAEWDSRRAAACHAVETLLQTFDMTSGRMSTIPAPVQRTGYGSTLLTPGDESFESPLKNILTPQSTAKKQQSVTLAEEAATILYNLEPPLPDTVLSALCTPPPEPPLLASVIQGVETAAEGAPTLEDYGRSKFTWSLMQSRAELCTALESLPRGTKKAAPAVAAQSPTPPPISPVPPSHRTTPTSTTTTPPSVEASSGTTPFGGAAKSSNKVPMITLSVPAVTSLFADPLINSGSIIPYNDVALPPLPPLPLHVSRNRNVARKQRSPVNNKMLASPKMSRQTSQVRTLHYSSNSSSTGSSDDEGKGGGETTTATTVSRMQSMADGRPLRAAHLRRRGSTEALVYTIGELRSMEDDASGVYTPRAADDESGPKSLLPPLPEAPTKPPGTVYPLVGQHRGNNTAPTRLPTMTFARKPHIPSQFVLHLLRRPQSDVLAPHVVDDLLAVASTHNTIFAQQLLSDFLELDVRHQNGVTAREITLWLSGIVDQHEVQLYLMPLTTSKKRASSIERSPKVPAVHKSPRTLSIVSTDDTSSLLTTDSTHHSSAADGNNPVVSVSVVSKEQPLIDHWSHPVDPYAPRRTVNTTMVTELVHDHFKKLGKEPANGDSLSLMGLRDFIHDTVGQGGRLAGYLHQHYPWMSSVQPTEVYQEPPSRNATGGGSVGGSQASGLKRVSLR